MADWRRDCYIEQVEPPKVSSGPGQPSVGPVYRSVFAARSPPSNANNVKTCWDLFSESVKRCPNNKMLGRRLKQGDKVSDYVWQTYKEAYDIVIAVGSAMRTVGLNPRARCGIYGANCPEWLIAMEACNGHSIYCVPFYDTLGADAVEFIVGHAEVSLAFVHVSKLAAMLHCLPRCTGYLKVIVSFGDLSEQQRQEAESLNIAAYSWSEFVDLGKQNPVDLSPPNKDDISTIMYTSGTTGEPKGVLLTHENITDVIDGVDRLLSVLGEKVICPMENIFQCLRRLV